MGHLSIIQQFGFAFSWQHNLLTPLEPKPAPLLCLATWKTVQLLISTALKRGLLVTWLRRGLPCHRNHRWSVHSYWKWDWIGLTLDEIDIIPNYASVAYDWSDTGLRRAVWSIYQKGVVQISGLLIFNMFYVKLHRRLDVPHQISNPLVSTFKKTAPFNHENENAIR